MIKDIFYKKIKDGENKKTFLLQMPFSYKKKTPAGYIDSRVFGLWKAEKKNLVIRYYIGGVCVLKKTDFRNEFNALRIQSKENLINSLLAQENDSGFFYIQVKEGLLFIFSKKAFKYDNGFIHDFFLKNYYGNSSFDLKVMPETCKLYQEHINGFRNENVLICKYIKRNGIVMKSIISTSPLNNNLFFQSKYLGTENYRIYRGIKFQDTPERKIVRGTTLSDYLQDKTDKEQKEILKTFFDWIFSEYQSEKDKSKLKGVVADGHLDDFWVLDGKFIFIDFDVISENDFSKNDFLWYALRAKPVLYAYFSELYGLSSQNVSHPFIENDKLVSLYNENMEKAAALNKDLLDKYFTEKYLVPEYD